MQIDDQERALGAAEERFAAVEAQLAAAHEERDLVAARESAARTEANQLRQQVAALAGVDEQIGEDEEAGPDGADSSDDQAATAAQAADHSAATNSKVDEILRLIERRNQALSPETGLSDGEGDFPDPGDTWPYPRGAEVWTLSGSRQTLVRLSDGADANAIWRPDVVTAAVEQFLSFRPRGGRVWMDDDQDAVTYLDGHLIYLGRMTDFTDPDAEPAPGTPWPPVGRKYRINRAGIYRAADEASLSKVRSPAIASMVRDRLLAIRPKGGVFRVGPDGGATTYVGGTWVYAGRVAADEWYPGDIR